MNSGNVLGVGTISVLPATTAYILFPYLHNSSLAAMIVGFAGIWAVSYVGVSSAVHFIKK